MIGGSVEFLFVAVSTALVAIVCGVLIASIAWVQMGYGPKEPTPSAMYSFVGAIACDVLALPLPWFFPINAHRFGVDETSLAISCLFLASFALLVVTMKLLMDYTGRGGTALKVGSAVLILVLMIGGFEMLKS